MSNLFCISECLSLSCNKINSWNLKKKKNSCGITKQVVPKHKLSPQAFNSYVTCLSSHPIHPSTSLRHPPTWLLAPSPSPPQTCRIAGFCIRKCPAWEKQCSSMFLCGGVQSQEESGAPSLTPSPPHFSLCQRAHISSPEYSQHPPRLLLILSLCQ